MKMVASKMPQILISGNIATENMIKAMRKAEEDYIQNKIREELNMQD